MKLVLKYGGTSISNTKDIQSVAKHAISLSKKNQLVIVCSATSGTTDDLIEISESIKKENKSKEDDEFEDWGDEEDTNDEKYWFTKDKIDLITSVHNYLDSLPEIGKVLSFSSILEVATQLNNNKPLGTLEMGVLYSKIPESIKTEIIDLLSLLPTFHRSLFHYLPRRKGQLRNSS